MDCEEAGSDWQRTNGWNNSLNHPFINSFASSPAAGAEAASGAVEQRKQRGHEQQGVEDAEQNAGAHDAHEDGGHVERDKEQGQHTQRGGEGGLKGGQAHGHEHLAETALHRMAVVGGWLEHWNLGMGRLALD
jgi:hypothetical protein